jgi:hypothetical protein
MNNKLNKWFWLIVIGYFLGLITFFFFGLGKIASIIFPALSMSNLKDVAFIVSSMVGASSFFLALITYLRAEKEKRFLRALELFKDIKELVLKMDFHVNRDQIIVMLAELDNNIASLDESQQKGIADARSAFFRSILKKVNCKNVFGEHDNTLSRVKPDRGSIFPKNEKFESELWDTACYFYDGDLVEEMPGGIFWLKDEGDMLYLLTKIIQYAQPIVDNNFYDTKFRVWKKNGLEDLYVNISNVPASIIYLYSSSERHKIFQLVKCS